MILLDGTNGKLDGVVSVSRGDGGGTAHDFRGVLSGSYDLQSDFCVLLDDLEILV